ncbi:MAG: hypothetical protein V1775_11650 [Bacteroidota bacterium]
MKKAILKIASATLIIFVIILNGCDSRVQDDSDTDEKIYFAKQRLETLQKESDTLVYSGVSVEKWEKFRNSTERKIQKNEFYLAELKTRIQKSGRKSDLVFERKTYILEQKNKNLRDRINAYPGIQSDWESFKNEITVELDDLFRKIKDMDNFKSDL